jgi:Uma2 family endonuclease
MTARAEKLGRPAVYADLLSLPEGVRGEIIDGELFVQPRPRARHSRTASRLMAKLEAPFHDGDGGPGGWWIVQEPGIELPGSPEVVPDLAGWRRERVPELSLDGAIDRVPDWVCEILSPSNASHDRVRKARVYARAGVPHFWLVDPTHRSVEGRRLVDGLWIEVGSYSDDEVARAEPFEAVALPLEWLWRP